MTRVVPPQKKRLQVFISSTFTDLREERQAAVEAILTAGHIPAGMELFTAGDESQMTVIKRWINESDIFMLILGSRYGSIEPTTGKSYIHIEYDYAVDQGKPVFAAVLNIQALDERVRRMGVTATEEQNPQELRQFREKVCSRMVRFWADSKDIKIIVHETMAGFARREDLRGWVRASDDIAAPAPAAPHEIPEHSAMLGEAVRALGIAGLTPEWTDFKIFKGTLGERIKQRLQKAEDYTFYLLTVNPEGFRYWLPDLRAAVQKRRVTVKWIYHAEHGLLKDSPASEIWELLEPEMAALKGTVAEKKDQKANIEHVHRAVLNSQKEISMMDPEDRRKAGRWELFDSERPHFYMAFLAVPGSESHSLPKVSNLPEAPEGTFGFVHLYRMFPFDYSKRPALYLESRGGILDEYYWSILKFFEDTEFRNRKRKEEQKE